MSFVVTTHNPLTLVGARPEEIRVLTPVGDTVTARPGDELPLLLTGGQLYQRDFGIHDIILLRNDRRVVQSDSRTAA